MTQNTVSKEFKLFYEEMKGYEPESKIDPFLKGLWEHQALTSSERNKVLIREKNESLLDFEVRQAYFNYHKWKNILSASTLYEVTRKPIFSLILGFLKDRRTQFVIPSLTSISSDGDTTLHLTIVNANIPALALVIESGVDVNAQNKVGDTAVHILLNGPTELPIYDREKLPFLHRVGADFDLVNKHKDSILHLAVTKKVSEYSPF